MYEQSFKVCSRLYKLCIKTPLTLVENSDTFDLRCGLEFDGNQEATFVRGTGPLTDFN